MQASDGGNRHDPAVEDARDGDTDNGQPCAVVTFGAADRQALARYPAGLRGKHDHRLGHSVGACGAEAVRVHV